MCHGREAFDQEPADETRVRPGMRKVQTVPAEAPILPSTEHVEAVLARHIEAARTKILASGSEIASDLGHLNGIKNQRSDFAALPVQAGSNSIVTTKQL